MRRILMLSGLIIAAILGVGVGGLIILFNTSGGRAFLAARIEPAIGAAIGGEAQIGTLSGAPPGRIIAENVRLADREGEWLALDTLTLKWSPLALARGAVSVEEFALDGVTFTRPPLTEESRPAGDADDGPQVFQLPDKLPRVRVRKATFSNIAIADPATGERIVLGGDGELQMGGRTLKLRLDGASADDADRLAARIDFDPSRADARVDIALTSDPGGALARLAGLNGPLRLTARGSGPRDDFPLTLAAEAGALASLEGEARIAAGDAPAVSFGGRARLGDAFADVAQLIGRSLEIDATLQSAGEETRLRLASLKADAGEATGEAVWRAAGGVLAEARAQIDLALAPTAFDDLADILGTDIALNAALDRQGPDYALRAAVKTRNANMSLESARTDLRKRLAGSATLRAYPGEIGAPAFAEEAVLTADLAVDLDDRASVSDALMRLDEATVFKGAASYRFADGRVSLDGDFAAPQAVLAKAAPTIAPDGALTGAVDAEFSADTLHAEINAALPALMINGEALAPSTLSAAFSGAPLRPEGALEAKTRDGARALRIATRARGDLLDVTELNYQGPDFTLTADGSYDFVGGVFSARLDYEGGPDAAPAPGFPVSGDLSLDARYGAAASATNVKGEITELALGAVRVSGLDLSAEGPPEEIAVRLSAKRLEPGASAPINDVALAGDVDIAAGAGRLTTLDLEREGVVLSLAEPARIALAAPANSADDERSLAIDNFRARIGASGRLSLDGAFSAARMRARIAASDAPVVAAAALVDLELDLDTDRGVLAEGAFSARSDLAAGGAPAIAGDLRWTGGALELRDSGEESPLAFDISAPLSLVREPSLSLDTEGPLKGTLSFDGEVETVAAFLPASLSTLEGRLKARADLAGALAAPQITGDAAFTDGAYTELSSGLSLVNMTASATARADAEGSVVRFEGGAAGAGQETQTITLNGDLVIGEESRLDAVLKLANARFAAGPVANARVDGEVTLAGPPDNPKTVGTITVRELNAEVVAPESTGLVDIDVAAADGGPRPLQNQPPAAAPPPMEFDVAIKADDRIFIRGRGLESEWSADVRAVSGDAGPTVLGAVNLRRGWIDFSGRRFDLTRGEIRFNRLNPNNPDLDLRAEYETTDGTVAAIVIGGRAQSPSVGLESTPSLPREDIMALVLFGKPATELTAAESLQMAEALASLAGVGPFGGGGGGGLTGSARSSLGLDLLNLDLDPESGGSALTVGKYVADGLFVSATQDVRGENGSVRIEYELRDNITVETELEQNGDQTVSANWKRDF